MVSIIVSFGMIGLLLASGKIYEGVKRFLMLLIDIFLKILNIFGIQINSKEYSIKVSRKFKQTFKDIKIVKKSKGNNKIKPSINIIALLLLIFSLSIVIINSNFIGNNCISILLFKNNPFPSLIKTQESMDATLIAILFSIISFSISKLISQWKETAKFRKAKKEMKLKDTVLCQMSSKELLDVIKQKDLDGYNNHLKSEEESSAKNF